VIRIRRISPASGEEPSNFGVLVWRQGRSGNRPPQKMVRASTGCKACVSQFGFRPDFAGKSISEEQFPCWYRSRRWEAA
jgi:hypothetical protein